MCIRDSYYLGEQNRQDEFAVEFDEVSVERGEHLYEEFGCGNCHGADGSGGAASYVEKRSGISVTWEAPAINNVFFRYDDSEVRYWLIYGRANSPMPAWGLEGGGPMNDGQLDDLIEYLHHFQIPQNEELATIDANVNSSLLRLDSSELLVENEISRQKELILFVLRFHFLQVIQMNQDVTENCLHLHLWLLILHFVEFENGVNTQLSHLIAHHSLDLRLQDPRRA